MDRKIWLTFATAVIGVGLIASVAMATPAADSQKGGKQATKGGTFTMELSTDIDYVDPQLTYYTPSWQLQYAAACKLFNWPDKEGDAGAQLTPEVAQGLPVISNNGKTYTFKIRPGFKFSNGQPVNALSFKNAMERIANPKMASQGSPFLDVVQGAQAVIDGKASSISGVKAAGNVLSVTLTKPAPDFLARLSMPFFQAIDTNLAKTIDPNGVQTYSSCGPYYFSSYTPNRSITLKRNPNYKGPRAANVDTIQVNVGASLEVMYQNTLNGTDDYAFGGIPPAEWANVAKQFGINKPNGRLQVRPELVINYVAMNRDRALFKDNAQLAKAVNWTIDRQAYVAQGGFLAGKRADQILPPGMAGFKDFSLYPLKVTSSTIAQAKKLAAGKTGDGKAVIWSSNRGAGPLRAQIVQYNLKQIGIDGAITLLPRAQQFGTAKIRSKATYDITLEGWGADYADPYDFLNILLDGSQIDTNGNNNYAYYNNPKFNKQMQQAQLLVGSARANAYAKLDFDMMSQDPPWAPTHYSNDRVLLGPKTGCVVINEAAGNGPDLAVVCKNK